jgi:hypothetical protein
MLTHREIQDILVSLERHYTKTYEGNPQDQLNPIVAKWILRDVNREVIKKIKQKYDGN